MDKLKYDLGSEELRFKLVIPFERRDPAGKLIETRRTALDVLVRVPDHDDVWRFVAATTTSVRPSAENKEDYDHVPAQAAQAEQELFARCCMGIRVEGRELTPEQIDKLDPIYRLKSEILGRSGLNNLGRVISEEESTGDEGVPVNIVDELLGERVVIMKTDLCDTEWIEHSVELMHRFAAPTAANATMWARAFFIRQMRSKGSDEVRVVPQPAKISALYEAMIASLEGYTVYGEPCIAANKPKWAPLVPYFHRVAALSQIFRGVSSKN